MGDVTVPRNATVKLAKVDGQLHLLDRARVQSEGESPIEVSGEVICEGDAEFEGSLTCSRLIIAHGRVEFSGDMEMSGAVEVEHGEQRVHGYLDAGSVGSYSHVFAGVSEPVYACSIVVKLD